MGTTRQIRNQIKSAKNIAKITKAMQMVAASKMKRAQDQAQSSRSYSEGISQLAYLLSQKIDPALHPLLTQPPNESGEIVLLIAPEKGLCGSLITSLARQIVESYPNPSSLEFVAIGKKAKNILKRFQAKTIAEFDIGISQPKFDLVPPIATIIKERFLSQEIGKASAIYTNFINTMVQKPQKINLLPLSLIKKDSEIIPGEYLFEPSAENITAAVLQMYLENQIYQLLLDAYASEQSARMVAMKNATDNAKSLMSSLTQSYNKARQASITTEIIDIATASMVLGQ